MAEIEIGLLADSDDRGLPIKTSCAARSALADDFGM